MVKMLGCVLLLKRLRSGHACDWIRRDHITWPSRHAHDNSNNQGQGG